MARALERWGGWRLGKEDYTLEYQGNDPFFDVDGITGAKDVIRRLFEINRQVWASPEAMRDLIRALEYLLDPDESYQFKRKLREEYEASKR